MSLSGSINQPQKSEQQHEISIFPLSSEGTFSSDSMINLRLRTGLILLCFLVLTIHWHGNRVEAQESTARVHFQEALRTLNDTGSTLQFNYSNRLKIARKLAHGGHRELSITLYSEFLADYPGDPDGRLGRGLVLSWEGQYDQAVRDFKIVLDNHPDYAGAWRALGNVYRWTDRSDSALHAYGEWSRVRPDDPEPHLMRAEIYTSLGRRNQAKQELNLAREKGADEDRVNDLTARLNREKITGKWSASFGYDHTKLTQNREDWKKFSTRVSRSFRDRTITSLSIDIQRIRRFGDLNTALVLDSYYDLGPEMYGNLRYLHSPQHDFLPRNDVRAEIFRSMGAGWEISGSYRRMDFTSSEIDIVGLTFGKYLGNLYFRGGLSWSRNNRREEGFSQSLSIRNYYRGNADDYWEISGGLGEDQVNVSGRNDSLTLQSQSLGADWQRFWTPRWGTQLSFSYKEPDREPTRRKFSVSLERRW